MWFLVLIWIIGIGLTFLSFWFRYRINFCLNDPMITKDKDLTGYYIIITGGNSGIGFESAKYFATLGAHVTIACRNDNRGLNAEKSINEYIKTNAKYKGGKVKYMNCNLASFTSVDKFLNNYIESKLPCHILLNNAGMGSKKFKFTEDNFELAWQVNYLGHFYLTYHLLPLLVESSLKKNIIGRIVNVSSAWHWYGYINFNVLNGDAKYQEQHFPKKAGKNYGRSKLAQIMHALYVQQQIINKHNLPLYAVSLHPGAVWTNIFKWGKLASIILFILKPWVNIIFRTPKVGAMTSIYCCLADKNDTSIGNGDLVPGGYHVNFKPMKTEDKAQQSTDPKQLHKLYQYSLNACNGLKQRTKDDYDDMLTIDDDSDSFETINPTDDV